MKTLWLAVFLLIVTPIFIFPQDFFNQRNRPAQEEEIAEKSSSAPSREWQRGDFEDTDVANLRQGSYKAVSVLLDSGFSGIFSLFLHLFISTGLISHEK